MIPHRIIVFHSEYSISHTKEKIFNKVVSSDHVGSHCVPSSRVNLTDCKIQTWSRMIFHSSLEKVILYFYLIKLECLYIKLAREG